MHFLKLHDRFNMQLILRERLLTSAVSENTFGHSSHLSAGMSPNLQLYYPSIRQQSVQREFLKIKYKTGDFSSSFEDAEDAAGAACELRFPIFTGCGEKSHAKITLPADFRTNGLIPSLWC